MNVELYKEMIVLIMGPIFQFIAYFILLNIPFFNGYINMIKEIHYTILIFNLMPIYPLDGGKLVNIILNYHFNFKKSMKLDIYISYLTVILISLYYVKTSFSLNIIFMICFLLYKINNENKMIKTYYEKFLLERYLNKIKYKKYKKIDSIDNMFREKSHIIKSNSGYISEREVLENKFNNKY